MGAIMNKKIIKTQIDGVPVELEILNIGPASPDQINRLSDNLAKEVKVAPTQVRVLKVGTDENPASEETIKKIEAQATESPHELIGDLIENITDLESGKVWWKSKTIWVNIVAVIVAIGATFGLNIPLDPELCMVIFPTILGVINLILRGKTDKAIKKK